MQNNIRLHVIIYMYQMPALLLDSLAIRISVLLILKVGTNYELLLVLLLQEMKS